ncbi:hypothetical protein F2P81_006992 [Scophthalmus maximus]|uniref:Uncharacterized protein n=1 Tax=Scophthalmus maximus TaxID=52904 RepID=A0A6A4TD38_SCOMX|nr:hypothetical protein F2P81_006990 [Scophthalmus maximus]KAF0041094.1 hypothetical protein F2P81_006992 [Scophthalmus maximus]
MHRIDSWTMTNTFSEHIHCYERLSGSASINMPHGVPEPDSGDEVDVVYTSRGGSIYRRYSFIHEQDTDADQDVDESTYLNQS